MNLLLACFLLGVRFVTPITENATGDGTGTKSAGRQEQSLILVNETGKRVVVSADAFSKLHRQTITAKDHAGTNATYSGVALADLLAAANIKLGKDLKGPLMANCLLIQAADGYSVVFSLAEADPTMTDHVVLVADQKYGKPLDSREGPYRLVVPSDKRFSRWVRQVRVISVEKAAKRAASDH